MASSHFQTEVQPSGNGMLTGTFSVPARLVHTRCALAQCWSVRMSTDALLLGWLALIKMLYQERHSAAAVPTCIAGVAAEGIC